MINQIIAALFAVALPIQRISISFFPYLKKLSQVAVQATAHREKRALA
jgi:hypothetical protein